MDLQKNEAIQRKKIQLLFLMAAGAVLLPFVLIDGLVPGMGYFLAEKYLAVPCLLFAGSALSHRLSSSAKRCLLLSVIAVLWFAAVQMHHHLVHMDTSYFGIFAIGYLLAFPYATVTEEGDENTGLKWIGKIYVAFSALMIVFGGMLLLDAIPEVLRGCLTWDGVRVVLLWHPNGTGCLFMLAIGFGLYFFTRSEKKTEKWALAILMVLQFGVLSLTNSRTAILLTCAMVGGTVFFSFWKGGWKRFLAGMAAALVVMAVLFCAYSVLFDLHTEAQLNKLMRQEQMQNSDVVSDDRNAQKLHVDEETGEVSVSGQSGQGDLLSDMKNLNSRTTIWNAALTAVKDNPSIQIWGTQYVSAEIFSRAGFWVGHAHNSWIQILMLLGIPGFLAAVAYTLVAVWNVWILIWRPQENIGKKVVAMMVICMLAAGFLEVYLFVGDMNVSFVNFLFFLCTGYLVQWNRKASETE